MCDNAVLDFKIFLRRLYFYYSLLMSNVTSNMKEEYVNGKRVEVTITVCSHCESVKNGNQTQPQCISQEKLYNSCFSSVILVPTANQILTNVIMFPEHWSHQNGKEINCSH